MSMIRDEQGFMTVDTDVNRVFWDTVSALFKLNSQLSLYPRLVQWQKLL